MACFSDLSFGLWCEAFPADGIQARHSFPNGYGVSVIKTRFSYGGSAGKFELAVTHPDVGLVYDTPVTSAVEGWLSEEDVSRLMDEVSQLPVREVE